VAVKVIGLKDNLADVLVPNQFSPSPITLTAIYQDITPNQVLNVQGMFNIALWLQFSTGSSVDIKIKCYKTPADSLGFTDGYSVFSIKTSSGVSVFSEQSYSITISDSLNAVFQVPTMDLINNVKIFIKGTGSLDRAEITAQSRSI
jgi:hypothetical protein